MGTDGAPLLELRRVQKNFAGNRVLEDISFTLRAGEVLGLVGENGAGKSTLMKILFGMDVIRETGGYGGQVLLDGTAVRFATPFDALAAGVGMVHQEFSLIPGFTAAENILLNREPTERSALSALCGDRLRTLDAGKLREDAGQAIGKLGVAIDPGMTVREMPVGHKQFTEIARELSKEHLRLLILDEPTAVLTEREAEALLEAVRAMAARGIAVIFITHRLPELLAVCHRLVILRDGRVVRDAPAREMDVPEITRWMVGREVRDPEPPQAQGTGDTGTVLFLRHLWVDMPGETVRDVNLEVQEGEILGIGGLAGQGKLGIPNGIMGLCRSGGTVEFAGRPIPLNSPRACLDAGLAFVSEDRRGTGLLLGESLGWNIAFPAMQVQNRFLRKLGPVRWRDEAAIRQVTEQYLRDLQIKCTGPDQRAGELSGGNQQKVCLAKALALEPRLLFVSEPTRGIDVGAKALVLNALRRINRERGVTVVVVSSELEELRQVCRRIAIVSGGRIAGILPASEPPEAFGMLMVRGVQ